jgi:FkbM family methyltransferase
VAPPVLRTSSLARAADLLGAHRSADRLHRLQGGGLVSLDVAAARGGRPVHLRMHLRHHGEDQVARQVGDGGLWGFEPPLPALYVQLVHRSPGDVVDVGANTGLYSLLAVATNRDVAVHAVEAFDAVADLLVANLELNGPLARRVRVHRLALSEENGRTTLYLPPPTGTIVETSASLDPTFKEEIARCVEVETRTLDDLWTSVGRPTVGVVKIDTEGTEHRVLRGARGVLDSNRPVVLCEVLPRGRMDELSDGLARAGYLDVRLRVDALVLDTAVAFDPDAWNHAFVPSEKLPMLEDAAHAVGLRLEAAPGRAEPPGSGRTTGPRLSGASTTAPPHGRTC